MAKVLTFKVGIEGLEDKIWRKRKGLESEGNNHHLKEKLYG